MVQIDGPILFITMEGDVKQKVSTINYTYFASYEALRKETCIVVKVPQATKAEQTNIEKSVKQYYTKYGKVKGVKYYKDGIDVLQMISNN